MNVLDLFIPFVTIGGILWVLFAFDFWQNEWFQRKKPKPTQPLVENKESRRIVDFAELEKFTPTAKEESDLPKDIL